MIKVPYRILGIFLSVISHAAPVWSQNEEKIDKDKVDSSRPILEEVFVTATKREKSLRDIAASISAFDGGELESRGMLSVNDILEQTPGVTSNSARPGDQRVVMRGISTSASPTSTVPYPVGIFIGDTALNEPYAASITPDLSAFDLAAVEVLKGPQGTLFGGAALSGVLRYRLNDPKPDQWELRYFAQHIEPEEGSTGFVQGAVINIPLLGEDGDLGARLAFIRREYPGVTDDLRPEQFKRDVDQGEGDQIRAAVLWQPSDALQVRYTFLKQDYDAENGLVISDHIDGPRATKGSLIPWPNRHEFGMQNLEIQYDWEHVRLVSSNSKTEKKRFNTIDSYGAMLGTPAAGSPELLAMPFVTDQESKSNQYELRLQSIGGERFEWLVGGYYLESPIRYFLSLNVQALDDASNLLGTVSNTVQTLADSLGLGALTGGVLNVILPGSDDLSCELAVLCAETDAEAKEEALFFDLTWRPWSRLELAAGARIYRTTVDGGFVGRGIGARLVNNGQSPADFTTSITEEGVNPKFSATFHL